MNLSKTFLAGLMFVAASAATSVTHAHDEKSKDPSANHTTKGQLLPLTEKDAAWAAKAKADYPTEVCVVSDDKLGADMGKPQDYIYRTAGQPDRLVRFCCKDCLKDFNADPNKYLKLIDAAAAKKKS